MKTNSFFARSTQWPRRSSALLISLLMLSLITIIAVAFLGTMNWELSASRRNYDNQSARSLAMLGMNTAVAQLRHGLDTWDNPYANFATNPPAFYWSISPGRLTRWSYGSVASTSVTNFPLFSVQETNAANAYAVGDGTYAATTNLVNLNAVMGDGTYPIAGITNTTIAGATAPNISVYWVNVLKNPANPVASSTNPLIGRYAFWVDDENAKININTADGTMKYTTNSLGLGSPSEVSLQALQQGGTNLTTAVATNIVYLARTTGLNSPKEILRAAGTTPDLYTNNEFNLTAYSRSPDLNIFGQPKMALMPILGSNPYGTVGDADGDMMLNGITLQPPTEIYPTPSQLAPYFITNAVNWTLYQGWFPKTPTTGAKLPWPMAVRQTEIHVNTGEHVNFTAGGAWNYYSKTNYPWVNGMMLANYLAGTNAAYKPVTWPMLPGLSGTTPAGFAGKYTPRQIDSIVAQVLDLGSRDISADYPYSDGMTVSPRYPGGRLVAPFFFMGWLSHQVVSGISRGPKLVGVELQLTAAPPTGTPATPASYYPSATLGFWEEWWLPSGYLGGLNKVSVGGSETITQGWQGYQNCINAADLDQSGALFGTNSLNVGAPLPRSDLVSTNYWGNQLLTDNQGIDFQGNPSQYPSTTITAYDPDQVSAGTWHDPFARDPSTATPPYSYDGAQGRSGASDKFLTPFSSAPLSANNPTVGWAPGEIRGVPQPLSGKTFNNVLKMWTNAGSANDPNLVLAGGIQVHSVYGSGASTDPEPVPLESIRGTGQTPTAPPGFMDGEFWTNSAIPYGTAPPTLRDRFMQAVIPVNMTVGVGAANSLFPATTALLIKPADPLVNKFPGDWVPTAITSLDTWATTSSTIYTYTSYDEYLLGFHASLADPDSFWMPQQDCAQSDATNIAPQTLIPRSARFPSIGYLQYLRTGIIPDDESNASDLLQQHGTPYRLLSFAPLIDPLDPNAQKTTLASSQAYPDWALLDLLYVPSILYSYGSPYGYYSNTNNVPQGYGNPKVLANFSTGGGSTPGRINPNGMVVYTTNVAAATPNITRTLPMQAVMYNLKVNQSLVQQSYTNAPTNPNPGYTGGSSVDYSGIAQVICSYIGTNGPLRMPGELCNIPEVYNLRPSVNHTRNDLIRQIIGNLTTQSDTFSVWVAGESLAKSKGNTSSLSATDPNWGLYQAGDQILSSVRYHFVVERYVDPGADGVYGNSVNAGVDGVVGTYDDPVDPINHPFQPRYLYRIVSSEEIR